MPLPPLQHWTWQGEEGIFAVGYRQQSCDAQGAPVLLVHGFGASSDHWRANITPLAEQQPVWALDLLGFGSSDKPRSRLADEHQAPDSVRYCFDLWAQQVADFACQVVQPQQPLQLVGNSIGGIVALRAAQLLSERGEAPAQVILLNCAQRALDDRRAALLPIWERWSRPMVKRLVRQRWLLQPLFRTVARPLFVRQVLAQAYPSGANVDQDLIELLLRPALQPGAVESFRGFVNLFRDHMAPELLPQLELPVRLLWGAADPWEPIAEARRWAESNSCIQELHELPGVGHCPHDEAPEQVNPVLQRWLAA
jgi:pimeloyl-ACP methyl ester carboxylesterase